MPTSREFTPIAGEGLNCGLSLRYRRCAMSRDQGLKVHFQHLRYFVRAESC